MSHIAVKARALFRKIDPLVPDDCEHARLMYAVFQTAVQDLISRKTSDTDRQTARHYLSGDMPHLQEIGIDAEYVRRVIRSIGILEDCHVH